MAEIKSAQADAFVDKPDATYRTFLVYGPDAGLVSERADILCGKFGVDLSDPFSLIRLDADTVGADRARLADEAHTVGMFGGSRLIRISGSTRRNLVEAVKPVLDHPPSDCWIVMEAGDLKRDSALRRAVEKAASGVAIPCYADDARAIDRLVTQELQEAGLSIDRDAREILRASLGGDRRATRNELRKLALYCDGKGQVTAADVHDIIGDIAALAMDDVVDAAISGNVAALEDRLHRLCASGVSPDMIALAGLRQFQALHAMRYRMERTRSPAATIVASLRPPIHFSRKDLMVRALHSWSMESIGKALDRLDRAALEARAEPALGLAITGVALLAIAREAARKGG